MIVKIKLLSYYIKNNNIINIHIFYLIHSLIINILLYNTFKKICLDNQDVLSAESYYYTNI
jgi:hypothetical protein